MTLINAKNVPPRGTNFSATHLSSESKEGEKKSWQRGHPNHAARCSEDECEGGDSGEGNDGDSGEVSACVDDSAR